MKPVEVGQHLVVQSRNGRRTLLFKGTRLSVAGVFRRLARGESVGAIVKASPQLTPEAIREAIELASAALIDQVGARSPEHPDRKPLPEPKPVGRYLIVHPNVCFSKLTFDWTRVPVATVLTFLGLGDTFEQLKEGYPRVKREAIVEAIRLAGKALVARYTAVAGQPDESAASGRAG
jgi:uncharacterized protein (DUF433 family)